MGIISNQLCSHVTESCVYSDHTALRSAYVAFIAPNFAKCGQKFTLTLQFVNTAYEVSYN